MKRMSEDEASRIIGFGGADDWYDDNGVDTSEYYYAGSDEEGNSEYYAYGTSSDGNGGTQFDDEIVVTGNPSQIQDQYQNDIIAVGMDLGGMAIEPEAPEIIQTALDFGKLIYDGGMTMETTTEIWLDGINSQMLDNPNNDQFNGLVPD